MKWAMRGAQLIRRARWLCLLSESTVAWEGGGAESRHKSVLIIESGAVGQSEKMPVTGKTPAPPGYAGRLPERQENFDLATYERLRVVTTELRRLVAEERTVEIRLSPRAVLSRCHLAKLLPWV